MQVIQNRANQGPGTRARDPPEEEKEPGEGQRTAKCRHREEKEG